ncbi:MAG: glycosyltransferase [Rhodospirillales bacterium]|nr:glycosyltransferase [Rhodospirillales bacterium]
MNILFAFENPLPSAEADAEVFTTTARYLAPLLTGASLHVPLPGAADPAAVERLAGMPVLRARAPLRPAALRHVLCGLTLVFRRAFRQADLVYTRNLWVAWLALRFGQRVAFDHYRPWPDQIPPLRFWLYRLICHPRFLVHICHSEYTRRKYLELGVPAEKLCCIHNGFEPRRLPAPEPAAAAKARIGVAADRRTVVYTGRINHKKGLHLVIEAARRLPGLAFILVGSYGEGPIEVLARGVPNVRIIPFQPAEALAQYVGAADVLLIPPSWQPLAQYGSTVLPLKLFFYLASRRPILAGQTPDVQEVLEHRRNAFLCPPDDVDALVDGLRELTGNPALAARLAAAAAADGEGFTWEARAHKIAALLAQRLAAAPVGRGAWGRAQRRAWREKSLLWLVHLLRTRSWVLPPDPVLPADPAASADPVAAK